MDFRDTPEEATFRQEVRSFIERELAEDARATGGLWGTFDRGVGFGSPPAKAWRQKLAARSWIAPAWPAEYGGAGMTIMQQFIFNEEMTAARAPRMTGGIGIGWAGPTIMLYGADEQKQRFLPNILSGEEIWCQGFSEPGSGSDLASLQTRAVRDGDDYVVNGQKIWTSGAKYAQWMILLARTDPDAPKHKGISYFIVDMKSPGITVRPLINMAGRGDFNEVFFDNVRVPKENLIGEENRGWYIGTTTLDFERSGIATSTNLGLTVSDLVDWAREHADRPESSLRKTSALRNELADRAVEAEVARLMSYRVISMQNAGLIPSKEASVAKLYNSELEQRIASTAMKTLGLYGQLMDGGAPIGGALPLMYINAVAITIGGGTSEIQRNIIAMRGLDMPRGF
ncbi:MAG: acyl-CoA dehydrogenase family protein [Dehalococcoidia bacterium]|nr:acyl-CoA dehydrogenase family protein [Dehalococcoidia bacterium]